MVALPRRMATKRERAVVALRTWLQGELGPTLRNEEILVRPAEFLGDVAIV